MNKLILTGLLVGSSSVAVGQAMAKMCGDGPGAALGLTGFSCGNCAFDTQGTRQMVSFRSEPVVLSTIGRTLLKEGDVVVAIDGKPITTREGGELFLRPSPGNRTVQVRRNGQTVDLAVYVPGQCAALAAAAAGAPLAAQGGAGRGGRVASGVTPDGGSGAVSGAASVTGVAVGRPGGAAAGAMGASGGGGGRGGGRASSSGGGLGAAAVAAGGTADTSLRAGATPTPPIEVAARQSSALRGVAQAAGGAGMMQERRATLPVYRDSSSYPNGLGFGFAVSCMPSCTKARASTGVLYWKYDGPPPVMAIEKDSPADRAGLRVGDKIETVDGLAIVEERGGLSFVLSPDRETLQLGIIRDGKTMSVTLRKREPM